MSFSDICEKLGFDPIKDELPIVMTGHEDDSQPSPFAILTDEESDFLLDYMIEHRAEMKNTRH